MRTFIFVCGLILGVFGLLSAQNLGYVRVQTKAPRPWVNSAAGGPAEGTGDAAPGEAGEAGTMDRLKSQLERELKEPQGKNLDPLAVFLDEAKWDRSWEKVEAAAQTIRAHGAEWVTPAIAPAPGASGGAISAADRSLFDLKEEVRRREGEAWLALRRNRATTLARSRDANTDERLFTLLSAPDATDDERHDAAWLLAKHGDERAVDRLVRLLSSASPAERQAAGRALAREGYLAGLKELARLLGGAGEVEVRRDAIRTLTAYAGVRAGEQPLGMQALVDTLRGDRESSVRAEAAAELRRCDLARAPGWLEALEGALERDDVPAVRQAAAQTLVETQTQEGLPVQRLVRTCERLLKSEREAAVLALLVSYLVSNGDQDSLAALDQFAASPAAAPLRGPLGQAREQLKARLAPLR